VFCAIQKLMCEVCVVFYKRLLDNTVQMPVVTLTGHRAAQCANNTRYSKTEELGFSGLKM
jgi:hypothetical protein